MWARGVVTRNPAVDIFRAVNAAGGHLEHRDGNICATTQNPLNDQLRQQITDHKKDLIDYLDTKCVRCTNPSYIAAYWGDKLCQQCIPKVVAELDKNNTWPEWP